jgi:hypothetical protein
MNMNMINESNMQTTNLQTEYFRHVTLIAHSDWSKEPSKRWMGFACKHSDQRWYISDLVKIDLPPQLFSFLSSKKILPGCILAGFDFPIGLPSAYALKIGITDFLTSLPMFGYFEWENFYSPAESPSEISLYRPFYPAKPGGSLRTHLEQGLGIPFSQLYRLCEVSDINRRAACPLFWTMGGQQVGKAAITGWASLLSPAINDLSMNLRIWPFSGPIDTLCLPNNIVVVETYPAEYYYHLGLSFIDPVRRSKRRQSDRVSFAKQLIQWAKDHDLDIARSLKNKIKLGFGKSLDGEDQFDALVGLFGMINIVMGNRPIWEPTSPVIAKIEGWIFGQDTP